MARPSKIGLTVSATNPQTQETREVPITVAICEMVSFGVWPGNASQMYGVTRQSLHTWRTRGADAKAAAAEHLADGDEFELEDVAEADRPYVAFLDALTRAEAEGMAWHEANVRRAAESGKEQGGRLSLEFLARRQRAEYSREVKVEHGGKVDIEVEAGTDERIDELVAQLESARQAQAPG